MKVGELSAAVSELGVVAAIAASHMSMPNHWLPYALMGAARKWSARGTLFVTFLGALGHSLTTIATVSILSQLGGAVLSHEAYRRFSCGFLLFIGLYYSYTYLIRRERDSCCEPKAKAILRGSEAKDETTALKLTQSSSVDNNNSNKNGGKVDAMAALSLIAVTSLSPCVGSMPVLLAFLKPPLTLEKVLLSSLVLLSACAGVMCSFVGLSFIGAKRMDFSRFRRHERLFLGVSFVTLAFLTYFVLTASSHDHSSHQHSDSHLPHDSIVHQSARQAHGLGGGGARKGCH